jgi:hypothetical protein
MTPFLLTIDEFFPWPEFELLKAYAHQLKYIPVTSPLDGVEYPDIGLPVPDAIQERLVMQFTWLIGHRVALTQVAFRLSIEGSKPPHWAHTDAECAAFSAFIFINAPDGCATALVQHRGNRMWKHPQNEDELEVWKHDYNKPEKWLIKSVVEAAPNRAIIMPANLMHAALPLGGMGTNAENGRLILLAFFE